MRILVADNDVSISRAIAALVTAHGFEVTCCGDGEAAWEMMGGAEAPPMAVLDWEMPKLTGVEVCRRIRQADRPQRPYLMLVTSKAEPGDIVQGLGAGADDYVCKPFSMNVLVARLKAGRRRVEQEEQLHLRIKELEERAV